MDLKRHISEELQGVVAFDAVHAVEQIQQLWSGYGQLLRVMLTGAAVPSVIVKRIFPPQAGAHPRGWHSDFSHQRKLRSYQVEAHWYVEFAHQLPATCRVPALLGQKVLAQGTLLVLEDLDAAGYPLRKAHLDLNGLKCCLSWLAALHARFMQEAPTGLWETGTYWHLKTRPEEWNAMPEGRLKAAAHRIVAVLNPTHYHTIIHGDAKYANFCFAPDGAVAAVDFQYTGGGCGMKDVAYLLSCVEGGLSSSALEHALLAHYFEQLRTGLTAHHPGVDPGQVEAEWRPLYCIAWADFERFLAGWAPGHWKRSAYSARLVEQALGMVD